MSGARGLDISSYPEGCSTPLALQGSTTTIAQQQRETNSQIIQKINAILDNKLDLGDFFGGYGSDKTIEDSPIEVKKTRPAPLSLGGDSSRLSDILGLPSSNSPQNHFVKTYKCGEFKFPDVSSPLNKILCHDYDEAVYSPSRGGVRGDCSGSSHFTYNHGSPTFDDAILMGVSDKWDVGRNSSSSPGSNGAYGQSYCSNIGEGGGGGLPIRGNSLSREQDSGISDIFKGLSLNESRVGSYCGSTSSVGAGSSLLDSPPPTNGNSHYFSSTRTTSSPPMPSISEVDPAVAQAVKNIQNLQALYNSTNAVISDSDAGASLERAARIHRNGTAIYDASCTWHGSLPPRKYKNIQLSCKVFLGGVPWDITEASLFSTFKPFGPIKIEWPGKDNSSVPRGYLYIIFENEKQVKDLLAACTHDYGNGGSWYYKISSRRMRNKEVQVIPWVISDSNFVLCPSQRLDPKKTVFVGALHGMLTAEGLCTIFEDLFEGVVYAGVDTDKYKYPQGSGRVTFNNHRSYIRAVSAAFIEIKAKKFTKKIQVDPYLEDELCSACGLRQGPYFCRDQVCFKYFCRYCWEVHHGLELSHHSPLMRNSKPNNGARTVPVNLTFAD